MMIKNDPYLIKIIATILQMYKWNRFTFNSYFYYNSFKYIDSHQVLNNIMKR